MVDLAPSGGIVAPAGGCRHGSAGPRHEHDLYADRPTILAMTKGRIQSLSGYSCAGGIIPIAWKYV